MGKQAKKRRQLAVTLASQAHPATQQATPTPDPPDPTTYYRAGDPRDPRDAVPSRINTRRETRVGPDWAPEFARYMEPMLPRIAVKERQAWLSWWDNSYVRGRLIKRLGKTTVMVALASLRDGDDTNQIARDWQHSPEWVRRQINATVKLAATYFTPREY